MAKLPPQGKSCNLAASNNALEKRFLPLSLKRHFLLVVKAANARRTTPQARYTKEEAVASYAIDVDRGRVKSVRSYMRIWSVPRSTVADWLKQIRQIIVQLINRYRHVDKRLDSRLTRANPDTPTTSAVHKAGLEPVKRTPKRRWKRALARMAEQIRTLTTRLLSKVIRSWDRGLVDKPPAAVAIFSYEEMIFEIERLGLASEGAGRSRCFYSVTDRRGRVLFYPTDAYYARLDFISRINAATTGAAA